VTEKDRVSLSLCRGQEARQRLPRFDKPGEAGRRIAGIVHAMDGVQQLADLCTSWDPVPGKVDALEDFHRGRLPCDDFK
jgi:hypothetical protein